MRKKLLSALCIVLIFVLFGSVACNVLESVAPEDSGLKSQQGQLNVLKSDLKLSQEQLMSQIKAEYLIENGGYKDSDEVVVILTLKDEALIDTYINRYYNADTSVGEYATTAEGIAQAQKIAKSQAELIAKLQQKGLIERVEHCYSTILNAVAVTIKYGNLSKLEKMSMVQDVILSDTYNRPQETSDSSSSVVENLVDVYETGIFNSSSVDYTGINTAVAILDSGFDCSHSVFQNQPKAELLINRNDVAEMLAMVDEDGNALSNAVKSTPNLKLSDVYYSDKIPFVYDYADKDPDVFPYDSEHGTHVAGIIGGHDSVITGVAINTQLVLMKVFPDLEEGANTEDILAALEDAVLLQVDAINMSLGSSCGFTRDEDGSKINEVYDKINDSGISLITAASNSYSSGYGGAQGNTNFVTNPDSATVGSPSTYEAALSVASISGTKSKYIHASDANGNNAHTFFFLESNAINGTPNDFMKELYQLLRTNYPEKYGNLKDGDEITLEYVTVPGVGLRVNYSTIDVKGKIALIRRGDNTFEEKAQNAKNAGAIACIIYNNIDGDIYMSMGKSDHVPTISISKDDGTILAQNKSGKMTISSNNQAGPFMSDFSSWGPTPSLELKPDITAHGGNIRSSVPGGGYDELSGTSMASPNLCGIVVLIRQYLKDNYDLTPQELTVMANQLLMSTATIALNQEGNPYSPRKQGAGLASLTKAVNTDAYITVDGKNRTKLELFDDPQRMGVYTMEFNVVNLSDKTVSYNLDLVGMTESVSTSDSKHVAEKAHLLDGKFTATVDGKSTSTVEVAANSTAKVTLVYTLTNADKALIDSQFPYGMYVEGFVKLYSKDADGIDLNVPFLAFYGDWTEAPMFDKTYYEVESEAHNQAIDDDDKIKADYYATTPYGSYWYNYIIPLGTYLYKVDTSKYDEIPATEEHIAISNVLGTIDGISAVYAGLLRGAKTMRFTITDKVTGEVVYEHIDYNARKAYSNGGGNIPYYEFLKISSYQMGLVNNRQYEFKMQGLLDYGDGGVSTNVRNSFSFDFYLDDEAPIIKEASYEKIYDKTLKKDRYYLTMTVYDNQYVQSINPIIFTKGTPPVSYTTLMENPIPVYGERGENTTVRFEITDYLDELYSDSLITSSLAFIVDDYALNSNIYICELPGTRGDFKFTSDGTMDGSTMSILQAYEGEVVDLTKYLATSDSTVDTDKSYLKYLEWSSSNNKVVSVNEGQIHCLKAGTTTVSVEEAINGKKANIIIQVKAGASASSNVVTDNVKDATVDSLRFSYFDTLFAYSRAAQTSEIGSTGDREYLSSMSHISFYPGEKVKLAYDFDPWYAKDNYDFEYSSTNETVAVVTQDGEVTALKKGSATIILRITNKHTGAVSNIMASVRLEVKSEFIIENRMLVAYKGLGGNVVIPDDEGILYIGAYSFCLYETDHTIELTEEDYDANKIPASNTTITSVVIPYGVEEIQKYAFYNCTGLRSVSIPSSCKFIREFAFYNDDKLSEITLTGSDPEQHIGLEGTKVEVIGRCAFSGCTSLENINLGKILSIGIRAFDGCSALQSADLTALRNTGAEAFRGCKALTEVTLTENTKLSTGMFVRSGLKEVDIYEKLDIPRFCFAQCESLEKVTVHNSLVSVGYGAFCECTSLTEFVWDNGVSVGTIGEQAFYGSTALQSFSLPNCKVVLGNYCFLDCESLQEVIFNADTVIERIDGAIFQGTFLSSFNTSASDNYSYDSQNHLLLNKAGDTVIFAAIGYDYSNLELVLDYVNIGDGAFAGSNVKAVTFANAANIGKYAFANCEQLETVSFAQANGTVIGDHAFNYTSSLKTVEGLDAIRNIGSYAFANSGLRNATIGADATIGEGAFFNSSLLEVTIGANAQFGLGAFQNCVYLTTVNMPEEGGVHFGRGCFARDTALVDIDLSKVDDTIEEETFYGCTSLVTAILSNVKYIGDYAFADCAGLRRVDVPVVVTIGEVAFGRYSDNGSAPKFTSITLPDTLSYLGEGVFLGCEGLTEIAVPSGITAIPDFTFALCTHLVAVELDEAIASLGQYSFYGCESLSEINLGAIKTFSDFSFYNTLLLQTADLTSAVTIGEGSFAQSAVGGDIVANDLVSLGDYAFMRPNASWGASLTSLTAPKLSHIGVGALQNNVSLTEFMLTSAVTYIGEKAFNGCTSLADFVKPVGLNSETTNNGKINDYALLDNGVLYTVLPSGHLQLASVPAAKQTETLVVLEDTYRVDAYAGNENLNVTTIVLPDSLKLIGNYAFYGYKNLKTVEFKSFTAPALESAYDSKASLSEEDPGYALLHNSFNLGGWELCYFNFIDLVGKNQPIKMILPSNEGIEGYDSLLMQAYFGKVEDAQRSDYIARDKNLVLFYEYAQQVAALKTVTLMDEKLISNAVAYYNAIPQSQFDADRLQSFGYSAQVIAELKQIVDKALSDLRILKLSNASQAAQQIQKEIDLLPNSFAVTDLATLQNLAGRISKLTAAERILLDMTNYNNLQKELNAYNAALVEEMQGVRNVVNSTYATAGAAATALAAAVVAIIIKKRYM